VDEGKQLGNGGFGAVYSNTFQGSDVAIKVLTRDNPNARISFQRECKILSSLNHPAIIRFYGTTLVNDNAAAVMECCPKGSLLNYIRNNPPLGFGQKIQIAVELASAVAYLHAKRLCHYDLKPANVLLTDKLEPKLCDFGLSDSSSKSAKGFTLTYCPPEQLQHKQ
jgi:serine/threonine protein kinase